MHPAKGGGVANIYDSKFHFTKKKMTFWSFERLVMKSMPPTQSRFMATVYRPPGPYIEFLTEFPEFLSDLVVMADNIHIFGDFNIHGKVHRSKRLSAQSPTQWVLFPDLLTATVILWT